jgi:serine protease inhibitor
MRVAFISGAANFDAMSPSGRDIHIGFVKNKTFGIIDEEGTEATAVANTGMTWTSAPGCFCVDRPFVFLIRERFSGTILFMGKVVRIP